MSGQGKYWMLTIPFDDWERPNELPEGVQQIRGQGETGTGGFRHWQLAITMRRKSRLRTIKSIFGTTAHCELSRSEAARGYVWKEETRIPDTQFEIGTLPHRRNSVEDWESVWELAKRGDVESIQANLRFHELLIKEFNIIELSELSMQTIKDRLLWSELAGYSGAKLELENRDVLGMKQEWTLILKIQGPNSGMVTEVKSMLSLMNFEEISMYRTCSAGSIDILSVWRSKAPPCLWLPRHSGSPVTTTPTPGSRTVLTPQDLLSKDE